MIVLGVDPGARTTGLCIIDSRPMPGTAHARVLGHATVERPAVDAKRTAQPSQRYIVDVLAAMRDALAASPSDVDGIAVEGVVAPTPHGGKGKRPQVIDPSGIISTAVILGAILGRSWPARVVVARPGSHGHQPWISYPPELVTPAEWRGLRTNADRMAVAGQSSTMRHVRSAFDIARTSVAVITGSLAPWDGRA